MGYIQCSGLTYGIIPKRRLIDSILINLPLINRLYTKEIHVHLTSRMESGAPICGISEYIRIYKNQNVLMIAFRPPELFTNVLLRIDNIKCPDSCRPLSEYKDTKYFPCHEYIVSLLVHEEK